MNKNKTLLVVFCILLSLFILLFSYQTTLYFTDQTPNQEQTINFLKNKIELGELNLDYTEKEISHLEDVKIVMKSVNFIFYFLLLFLTLIMTNYKKDKEQILRLLKFGGISTVVVVLVVLLLSLISFNTSFTFFHQIFFPQGNWTFPADSLLIQTFPLQFFISISRNILLQSLVWSGLLGLFYFTIKKRIDFSN